jgi:hypothetical protein
VKTAREWVVVAGVILIAILAGESPVVKAWARFVDDHRS